MLLISLDCTITFGYHLASWIDFAKWFGSLKVSVSEKLLI